MAGQLILIAKCSKERQGGRSMVLLRRQYSNFFQTFLYHAAFTL